MISKICYKAFCTFCIIAVCTIVVACGGDKEEKKVSAESLLAVEAFNLAETLRNAYLKNNRKVLENNSTQDAYRDLIGAIKQFDRAELSFTPTWVDISDSTVQLTISWKGTWTVHDRTLQERGSAVFVLEGTPLKLVQIQRENPFNQPE